MNNTTETTTTTVTRGVCILQHYTPGDMYAISCGTGATHLVMHKAWGRGNVMECCSEMARELSDSRKGYTLYAWDSLTGPAPIPAWVANYIAKGGQS
jgi:hypothetical protein